MTRRTNRWPWICSAAVAVAAFGLTLWPFTKGRPFGEGYHPPAATFDDTSDRLERTVVLPTLDSPIPEGKSAIWCVSFQLAWNRLKDEVAREPMEKKRCLPYRRARHSAGEEKVEEVDLRGDPQNG
ncbi:MAG TPA: hypothetical protein VFA26_22075 [Gemmataceae bacterium]|nr:hypothetical protein [Gemmataceae bacterium]